MVCVPYIKQQGYFVASTANPYMIGFAFCFCFLIPRLKTMKPESYIS